MTVINFDSRQCERVRRQLDAYLSNELSVETSGEVARHLEGCPACSAELESRMKVRRALRNAVEKQSVPERLGAEVSARLRKTQPGFSWPVPATWGLALASVALIVIVGATARQVRRLRSGREMVARVLSLGVSDHDHCAIRGHNYPDVAHTPDELREKLGPQNAGLVPVVEAKLPGFQLLEAHICSVPGSPRKYVHFIARGKGTILSVILTRREGEILPGYMAVRAPGGVDLFEGQQRGYSVAGFEANDYFGFVVSDLGKAEVAGVASSLAPAVSHALSAGAEKAASPALWVEPLSAGLEVVKQ